MPCEHDFCIAWLHSSEFDASTAPHFVYCILKTNLGKTIPQLYEKVGEGSTSGTNRRSYDLDEFTSEQMEEMLKTWISAIRKEWSAINFGN